MPLRFRGLPRLSVYSYIVVFYRQIYVLFNGSGIIFLYYCRSDQMEEEISMRKRMLRMKIVAGIAMLMAVSMTCLAQEEVPERKGKFFLVPELWLSFGTLTYVDIAPLVGYHLTDRLAVGLGPHYIYQSRKATPYFPYSYKTHVYGGKAFARFSLIRNAEQFLPLNLFNELFIHAEYEGLSLEKAYYYAPAYPEEGRFLYQGFLVGGGITQRLGLYNSLSIMILWNLNDSSRSPYSNPVFRIGFNAYF